MQELNAKNLKSVLWLTLNDIRSGDIKAPEADAIAAQAREILRATRTQLAIIQQAAEKVSSELLDFATSQK